MCRYLDDFKKEYYSKIGIIKQGYPADGVPQYKFIDYILEKDGKALKKDKKEIEEEIIDLSDQKFFNLGADGYWISPGGTIVQVHNYIKLGLKGRQLIKENFLKRWMYFFQFAYEEHSYLYTFILGGGFVVAIGIVSNIFQIIICFILGLFKITCY